MTNERKITKQLMTSVVQGLIDAGCTEEARRLSESKSTQEFDTLCRQYCVDAGPAGIGIERIMFLFYDWDDDGDDAAAVEQFKEKYGMHPAQSLATARLYWSYLSVVTAEWRKSFPELFTRFDDDDVRRIPWTLKLMYSVTVNDVLYAPVPDYGAPLKAIVRQIGATGNRKAVVDRIPEGMTIKEYDTKKAAMKKMNLFDKKADDNSSGPVA